MNDIPFIFQTGDGPIIAAAIHAGHDLRPDIAEIIRLSDQEREREEDPNTSGWTKIGDTQIICNRSRFEVDLNRPRNHAVYLEPKDAWDLDLYYKPPSERQIADSLDEYDCFYKETTKLLDETVRQYGRFILLDIHSYNHRRQGADGPEADPETHPEVNIGTGSITQVIWRPIIDRFISDLRDFNFLGRKLDVRENIKFKGGNFPTWINSKYPQTGCAIAIEFKKFWMNEWIGEVYEQEYNTISQLLMSTVKGLRTELEKLY